MLLSLSVLFGYLLGSIPFPYLLGKLRGQDLFLVGTGNPGAANLFRKVSKPLGATGAVLDLAKGAASIAVANSLGVPEGAELLAGVAAVVGHWHSLFLRFRGGEALATAVGVAIGAAPLPALAGTVTGLAVLAVIRSTGHAAALAWPVFIGLALLADVPVPTISGLTVLMVIITIRAKVRTRLRGVQSP
jgi:glycerol-3-phosphate acyltransferase PlsY